jgi:pimeloyl-ACP methyl ester carboxylesterase
MRRPVAELIARGVRFHVQRLAGTCPEPRARVVFLHGLVMDNLSSWYFSAAPALIRVADVLLYDLRGHGKSEQPKVGYGLADMVADLAALLDADGDPRPVYLAGNSFGGLLALAFASAYPARVRGVALVDGHVGHEGFAAQMTDTLRLTGEARDQRIAASFQAWVGRHSDKKRTRLADAAQALVGATSLVDDLAATVPLDAAALARITVPVLGVYGEHSDLLARAREVFAALPQARFVVVPGASHSVLWEATDLVRGLLIGFVGGEAAERLPPGAAAAGGAS